MNRIVEVTVNEVAAEDCTVCMLCSTSVPIDRLILGGMVAGIYAGMGDEASLCAVHALTLGTAIAATLVGVAGDGPTEVLS